MTLTLMVARVMNPDIQDEELEKVFILTHHNFCPSRALLKVRA